jgi:uncharacterized membrane protein (DUF4010 family)
VPPSDDLFDLFQRLGLALAIGFLVGVERGWKQRKEAEGGRVAGLRTFTLVGLLGGVGGLSIEIAGPIPFAALLLAFGFAFAMFELREAEEEGDDSVTSTVAGLLVFGLGAYAAIGNMVVASAAGVAVAAILAFKQSLHAWLRALTWTEIRSALLILAATFIALPLLPDRTIDPWGAVNPRSLWLLTILVAAASFGGYIALRALGPKAGLIAGSLAGAIVSSTAVTLDLARRARADEVPPADAASAASIAAAVMLTRVGILSSAFSAAVLAEIWPPLLAAGATSLAAAALLRWLPGSDKDGSAYQKLQSPLDLLSVGRFALVLAALTIAANLASAWFGSSGLTAFAASAGLVDVDAVTLAVGNLTKSGLAAKTAAGAMLIAVVANTLFKVALGAMAGSPRFTLWFAAASAATLLAGLAAYLV